MSFDLLNRMQLKHLSFQQELKFTEYFFQYLHFNLPQFVPYQSRKTPLITLSK